MVEDLSHEEPEAIIRTLAMMAYNPAIARVLERNGVRKFESLMVAIVPGLSSVATQAEFDAFHSETCERIIRTFKTNKNEGLSWGQAQKPLNVFLKVYIAWAKLPEIVIAERLQPLLHVPLDSVLMGFIKQEFPDEYHQHIEEGCVRFVSEVAALYPDLAKDRITRLLVDSVELKSMQMPLYFAWQGLLRFIHPDRPSF
ncbi:MAG: hypothetical protein ACLP59_10405 [Bryobacteraceae bacterium]